MLSNRLSVAIEIVTARGRSGRYPRHSDRNDRNKSQSAQKLSGSTSVEVCSQGMRIEQSHKNTFARWMGEINSKNRRTNHSSAPPRHWISFLHCSDYVHLSQFRNTIPGKPDASKHAELETDGRFSQSLHSVAAETRCTELECWHHPPRFLQCGLRIAASRYVFRCLED